MAGEILLPVTGWKNKQGTADRACICGSWQQHWINLSRREWPYYCTVAACTRRATVGAHVINTDARTSGEWIVPLCDSCNKRTDAFTLTLDTALEPANRAETCEKRR
jgi:hypothetical protein